MATTGVKGSDCYSSTGSTLCDLYAMLNRGLDANSIKDSIVSIFTSGSVQERVDAIVLAFQTRDIRGGKGERDLFRHLFCSIMEQNPDVALSTLDLIPEYGYWEDVNQLAQVGNLELEDACIKLILTQFVKDEELIKTGAKISLVARHMPREHNKKPGDKALAKKLAYTLCPDDKKKAFATYRKRLSAVTKVLDVAETHMSGGSWASLNPATIPGRCLKTHMKAFLNQPVSGAHGRRTVLTDPDRVTCATKFSAHLAAAVKGEAKVKGSDVVYPHELVKMVYAHIGCQKILSTEELDGIEAQWRSIVDPIKALGILGRWLPMCDFSGSMDGDPLFVSMALGLIIAECNTGAFKDSIITFDSKPTLHRFASTGLVNRVNEVRWLSQGTSTNFQAAYNLLIDRLITEEVEAGEEPTDLIVLTDMGFDQASGTSYGRAVKTKNEHETHFQIVRRAFKLQSEALGKGWTVPRVVCWNLRAEYKDFQALSKEEGVLQVSGWSPSMFRILATRGLEAFNPESILSAVLSDPRYNPVRERVAPFFYRPAT